MQWLVWVSAFGYFVDVYDLLLFSIVRVESLRTIGVPEQLFLSTGVQLINLQMLGILIGGVLWGLLGDRKGRVSVLLGSILLYSVANLLNAFVSDVTTYGVLRFFAGLGLAGELGAAITLVAESLSIQKRSYGAMVVAGIGLLGAVAAGLAAEFLPWRVCYALGGIMGLLLLLGRWKLQESMLFLKQKRHRFVFTPTLVWRYLRTVTVGIPLWFTSGLLITFAPEFAKALKVEGTLKVGRAVLICYGCASFGDVAAGWLSLKLQSRKKTIALFMLGTLAASAMFLTSIGWSASAMYALFGLMGFAGGYWAMFVLQGSEQFGTNIRSTVTVSLPNMVRGAVVVMTLSFQSLTPAYGVVKAATLVGITVLAVAYASLFSLPETFSRNLDFSE